jgi:hypothetical protein
MLGAGGAIFAQAGTSLTISGGVLLPGTVAGGTGGSNLAGLHGNDGGAAGSGIFVQSGTTVALGVGQTS